MARCSMRKEPSSRRGTRAGGSQSSWAGGSAARGSAAPGAAALTTGSEPAATASLTRVLSPTRAPPDALRLVSGPAAPDAEEKQGRPDVEDARRRMPGGVAPRRGSPGGVRAREPRRSPPGGVPSRVRLMRRSLEGRRERAGVEPEVPEPEPG